MPAKSTTSSRRAESTTGSKKVSSRPPCSATTTTLIASAKSGGGKGVSSFFTDALTCTCGQQFNQPAKLLSHFKYCSVVAIAKSQNQQRTMPGSAVEARLVSGHSSSSDILSDTASDDSSNVSSYWSCSSRRSLLPKVNARLPPQSRDAQTILQTTANSAALSSATTFCPLVAGRTLEQIEKEWVAMDDFELEDSFEPCPSHEFGGMTRVNSNDSDTTSPKLPSSGASTCGGVADEFTL